MNLPNRRAFHRVALSLALAGWAAPRAWAQAAPRWSSDPFALGVASGQPREDSVVLWTRLVSAATEAPLDASAIKVRWEVFADDALRQSVQVGDALTDQSRAHSVHVEVKGLAPGRSYWYRFTCGDAVSRTGRTRTAPAADAPVDRLRIALASCQHYEQGFFTAHREIATRDLDLVMFVGDYIYEGSNPAYAVRSHGTPTPHSLAAYRERHALYKRDPDLQAAHAAHPWLLTWDDHEVVNDYAGDRDPGLGDPGRFLRRRASAYRAYFEHMPLIVPPVGASMRIHDRFAWGRLADMWMLDNRQYRSPHACASGDRDVGRVVGACAELDEPGRSMLGAAQERWLSDGLAGSRRSWKLLGQSTQMCAAATDGPEGRQVWTDGWDGYPQARRRLLQAASDADVRNLVVLGGDVHRYVAADLRLAPNDPRSALVASELVGGSVSSRGPARGATDRLMRDNPDLRYTRGDERGYALLDIGPGALHCEFRATPHPAREGAALQTQASFSVEAGMAGVQAG